jgi:hypothetical protein
MSEGDPAMETRHREPCYRYFCYSCYSSSKPQGPVIFWPPRGDFSVTFTGAEEQSDDLPYRIHGVTPEITPGKPSLGFFDRKTGSCWSLMEDRTSAYREGLRAITPKNFRGGFLGRIENRWTETRPKSTAWRGCLREPITT